MVVRADGGYSSASDLDEEAYAFLAANNVGEGEVSHQDEELNLLKSTTKSCKWACLDVV
jgi:hypothetical protein